MQSKRLDHYELALDFLSIYVIKSAEGSGHQTNDFQHQVHQLGQIKKDPEVGESLSVT